MRVNDQTEISHNQVFAIVPKESLEKRMNDVERAEVERRVREHALVEHAERLADENSALRARMEALERTMHEMRRAHYAAAASGDVRALRPSTGCKHPRSESHASASDDEDDEDDLDDKDEKIESEKSEKSEEKRREKKRRVVPPRASPSRRGLASEALQRFDALLKRALVRVGDFERTLETRVVVKVGVRASLADGSFVAGSFEATPNGRLEACDGPAHAGARDADAMLRELATVRGVFDENDLRALVDRLAASADFALELPDADHAKLAEALALYENDDDLTIVIDDASSAAPEKKASTDKKVAAPKKASESKNTLAAKKASSVIDVDDDDDDDAMGALATADLAAARIDAMLARIDEDERVIRSLIARA